MKLTDMHASPTSLSSMQKKLTNLVHVSDNGDVTTSSTTANTAFNATLTAISNTGCVINPANSLVDFTAVTIPNGVQVIDMASQRIIMSMVGVGKSTQASGGHLLIKDTRVNNPTRVHMEPSGYVIGTSTKLDMMFDPYDTDGVNYRILNFYTKTYDAADVSTTQGNNGVATIGVKGVGTNFGIWPTLHMGFSDDGAGAAVPLKMYYFDTSDTVWRVPMRGSWRAGASVNANDYMVASNKLYQSSTTGVCGATMPTHTTGVVSDGVISWTFIRDYGAVSGNIKGCVVIGDRDDMPKFGNPTQRLQLAKDAGIWNGSKLQFLDNTGAPACNIFANANTTDLNISTPDGTSYIRFSTSGKFVQLVGLAVCCTAKNIVTTNTGNAGADAATDALPDLSGVAKAIFAHTTARSINGFLNLPAHATILIAAGNGNTTLVHNAAAGTVGSPTLATATNANRVLSTGSCLQFVVNSAGTQAIEVGRI